MNHRIIGAPVEFTPGDRRSYLVHNRVTGRRSVVDRESLETALYLDGLAHLEDHVRSLAQGELSHLSPRDLSGLIHEAIRQGLLATEEEVLQALTRNLESPAYRDVSCICWISRNRPNEIHTSVENWKGRLIPWGRPRSLLVFDDSDRPPPQQAGTIQYDRSAATGLIRYLTAKGVPEKVAQFAFLGAGRKQYRGAHPAYGANRNRCLALTAGQSLLMLDDDVSCRIVRRSSWSPTPTLSNHVDPTHVYYYAEEAEDLCDERFEELEAIDPLAMHDAYLGQPLGNLHHQCGLDLSTINQSVLSTLIGRQRRCRLTQAGHFGASATRNRSRLLHLAGPTRGWHDSNESFLRGLRGTRSRRWVDRPVLSTGSAILSMIMGVDNSSPTPPFLPIGRGDEWIWSTIFQACEPIFIAYLPECVHHRGAPGSGGTPFPASEYRFSITECFRHLVALWHPSAADRADPVRAMGSLGSHLVESAHLSWGDFVDHLTPLWIRQAETTRDRIEDLLVFYDRSPEAWADAAGRFLKSIERHLESSHFCSPFDIPIKEDSYRATAVDHEGWPRGAFLQLVEDYGHLLQWWGEIWRLSRDHDPGFSRPV